MKINFTYDKEADAAYILLGAGGDGSVKETITYDDLPANVHGDVNLDFDKEGRLQGIEILGASKVLPPQHLDKS